MTAEDLLHPTSAARRNAAGGRDGPARLLAVFHNGDLFRAWLLFGPAHTVRFRDVPHAPSYYRVELIGDPKVRPEVADLLYGKVLALTNPIYVGFTD